tara:strand:+ start:28 stop:600 length:573 start_codon:yes stop_codon:yes gene_type:complete
MKFNSLKNFGFIEDRLPKNLFNILKEECKYGEKNNPEKITGLTNKDVAKHRNLVSNKEVLWEYINTLMTKYDKVFPGVQDIKVLTNSLPFCFGDPWINYQRKGEYIPNHSHDGLFSYTIWLNIPTPCIFEFTYTNIIGNILQHEIHLTKEDEGRLILFPSKLPHVAYPFNDSEDVRISISGNILFESSLK